MASAITDLAHLQISLQKILDATNNFSDKNIIGKGDFGKVYRGKLDHDGKMIKIAARRLDRKYGHGNVEFWKEVSTLSSFRDIAKVVAMIGFCDEKDEKIVIYDHYPKGSLLIYIRDPTLTWIQRLDIACLLCSGGIVITHSMYNHWHSYIIHRNINSSTILLDEEWEPRLSGFEFSIKHSVERKNEVVISEAIGTQGYIDPAIEKYGGVSHKSDIYSVGVVLFELLCGRKAFEDNTLLVPLAKFHYENGTLKDIIHPDIWNRMDPKSFKCFSKAAYSCLQEDPTLRPDAGELWKQLSDAKYFQFIVEKDENGKYKYSGPVRIQSALMEEEVDKMQHEKHPIFELGLERSSTDLLKVKKWEHLRIELTHIHSPPPPPMHILKSSMRYTETNHITFKQEIEYYDKEYVSFVEQKNTNELPKRRHTVSAKMVEYNVDVLLREIEILNNCRHPNIQSFLGFYDNGHMMMLFYEYVSNKYLYHSLDKLKWGKCLKICIDVANGLDYLHNGMEDQKMVIHGHLDSSRIELDDILGAKIVGFEKSVIFHSNQNDDSIRLKRESDIFSFGLVMFKILCGRNDFYNTLAMGRKLEEMVCLVRELVDIGRIKKVLATGIKEENYGSNLYLKKGPNEESLDTFINIAYKCLAESENQRPEIKVVVNELHKALSFHENHKDPLRMSFNDIKLATQDFDRANCVGGGGFGRVYKGELAHGTVNGHTTIVAKKLDKSQGQGEKQYYNELQILYEYNHENVIGLVGYSNETDEKLIVYEHASKGSLDKHLNNVCLTWGHRLKICINVVTGLNFLHEGIEGQVMVIHRDIKAANILLFDDWKAKIGDFGLSLVSTLNKRRNPTINGISLVSTLDKKTNFTIDHPCGTKDYVDPMYLKSGILTVESDVYSLGVTLIEILCGRATYVLPKHESQSLLSFIKHKFEDGKQDEVVFRAIKEEIRPKSLTTFLNIVYKCLDDDREKRPTTKEVLAQLEKALKFQDEDKIGLCVRRKKVQVQFLMKRRSP